MLSGLWIREESVFPDTALPDGRSTFQFIRFQWPVAIPYSDSIWLSRWDRFRLIANSGCVFAKRAASGAHPQGAMMMAEVILPDFSSSDTAKLAERHIPKSSALIIRYFSIEVQFHFLMKYDTIIVDTDKKGIAFFRKTQ